MAATITKPSHQAPSQPSSPSARPPPRPGAAYTRRQRLPSTAPSPGPRVRAAYTSPSTTGDCSSAGHVATRGHVCSPGSCSCCRQCRESRRSGRRSSRCRRGRSPGRWRPCRRCPGPDAPRSSLLARGWRRRRGWRPPRRGPRPRRAPPTRPRSVTCPSGRMGGRGAGGRQPSAASRGRSTGFAAGSVPGMEERI